MWNVEACLVGCSGMEIVDFVIDLTGMNVTDSVEGWRGWRGPETVGQEEYKALER